MVAAIPLFYRACRLIRFWGSGFWGSEILPNAIEIADLGLRLSLGELIFHQSIDVFLKNGRLTNEPLPSTSL